MAPVEDRLAGEPFHQPPTMQQEKQGYESHLLTGKGEILERLRDMARRKILVTAVAAGRSSGFITTIVKVLPEKGLMAVDASVNEDLNADILGAESVRFSAQVDGVAAAFTAIEVREATLGGQQVFAIPIPETLYWLQRRAFYRVPVLLCAHIRCRIPLAEEEVGEFDVLDLSLRGVGILDYSHRFDAAPAIGTRFMGCSLDAPALKDERFALELRNLASVEGGEGRGDHLRLGFQFRNFSRSFEVLLQKLLYELEVQRKQAEMLVRDKS